MPTLKEILVEYLEKHDYDGFYCGSECHCEKGNIMWGSMCQCLDCQPGYAVGDAEDWVIGPGKEET